MKGKSLWLVVEFLRVACAVLASVVTVAGYPECGEALRGALQVAGLEIRLFGS